MINRRDFLKGSAAAGALIACGGVPHRAAPALALSAFELSSVSDAV